MSLTKTLTSLILAVCLAGSAFAQTGTNADKVIKQLGEKIQKVTPIVENSGNADAKAALAKGVEHYNAAVELNKLGKEREALKECALSARLVVKAYALATGQTSLEVMIKRLGAYIEKVKVIVDKSGNVEAKAVLEKGVEHYTLAVELAKQGKEREAFVQLKISAKLVAKAEAIAKAQLALNAKIKRLGVRIDVVKVLVDKSTNPEAKTVFALGVEHYNKAVELNKAGKLRAATAELVIAARLIEKAAILAQS
jgi:predicted secreted protein